MKKLFVLFFLLVSAAGWCVGSSTQTLAEVSNYPKLEVMSALDNRLTTGYTAATYTTIVTYSPATGYDGLGSYTIQVPGYYDIIAGFQIYMATSGNATARIMIDGSPIRYCRGSSGADLNLSMGIKVSSMYLTTGQVVSVQILAMNDSLLRGDISSNYFSVHRVP